MKRIEKVLVANRGEIAVRVVRALRETGRRSVAVYSTADADALHVRLADESRHIGPPHPKHSYLNADAILEAAAASGADAIHPGYGFLSENAGFAAKCEAQGLVFIGPPVKAIALLGDKLASRRIVAAHGLPVLPGSDAPLAPDVDPGALADEIGYPLLVKAAFGGGGKGMRRVDGPEACRQAVEAARREANKAFGDGTVFLEKFIDGARHVEFQVLGDLAGDAVHLFDRECSIQRRHQKLVEESPSPALDEGLRAEMGAAAVAIARAAHCANAVTVEFLLGPDRRYYFLEVNTRIQVEHPVTECVTGIDLVTEQIRLAEGHALGMTQADIDQRGHAIECRVMAEDPARDFVPSPGRILFLEEPGGPGIRVETGVEAGAEIPVDYDPILSKVIAHGPDRATAIRRMARALREYVVLGVPTTIPLLRHVIEHDAFGRGATHTGFIEEHFHGWGREPGRQALRALSAAVALILREEDSARHRVEEAARPFDPWRDLGRWELGSAGEGRADE